MQKSSSNRERSPLIKKNCSGLLLCIVNTDEHKPVDSPKKKK